jgi:hypothetical protein
MARKIIIVVLPVALASVHVAEAQQPTKFYRIGLLTWAAAPPPSSSTPFERGLHELGYVEGQNIVIETDNTAK